MYGAVRRGLLVLLGSDSDPLNLQDNMRIGGGLVAFLLAFPLVGLCLAKRRLATATILRKTESALAAVTLFCGISLLGLSGFFSSGTHHLASAIGGWAVEAIALLGILLLVTSCTLCTAPDTQGERVGIGERGGGSCAKECAGRLLAVLSFLVGVAACMCFFAQQTVFDAIGNAVSDEELEELLGDLHAIYCADHYNGGDSVGRNDTTTGSWGWEVTEEGQGEMASDLDVEFEAEPEPRSGHFNASSADGLPWGDQRDCEEMLAGGRMMEHAGLRTWADLSPLVFAWLDTAGRWLVLLFGVTTARAVLLLKCATSRHDYGSASRGMYAELDSDQAGVM